MFAISQFTAQCEQLSPRSFVLGYENSNCALKATPIVGG
jgi:hypothetical protein